MKKGKIVTMPTSLEAQIRTRARNLAIEKCYINCDWETSKMANVVVTRRHSNGNLTFGVFLVDLFLLGVKECFYQFNVSGMEVETYLDNGSVDFEECDYNLAHNIVYGGIAYAEDYGFEPCRTFAKTGKYVLEEDSDDIPLMEIPVGYNGAPAIFITPGNDMQHERAILNKTAGPGNYNVFHVDEDGNVEEDDFDDEIHGDGESYIDVIDDITEMGIEEYMDEYGDDISPVQLMALTDVAYYSQFGFPETDNVEELADLIFDDERFDPSLDRLPGMDPYVDSLQSIINNIVDDEDVALVEMEALCASHPNEPDLGILHINLLRDFDRMPEVGQLTVDWYNRAGDYYAMRLIYAEWLIDQERYDDLFELFDNKPGLDALSTGNVPFTEIMVAEFCACYTLAWLGKDNIEQAEPYYRIILEMDSRTGFVNNALMAMMTKKKDALMSEIDQLPNN